MPLEKIELQPIDGVVPEDSDPSPEEVNQLRDSLGETDEDATRRIDVLEDMLDIMNE